VLGDVLQVVAAALLVPGDLLSGGGDHLLRSVVEVYLVVLVDGTQVVGLVVIDVLVDDQVQVILVLQHNISEQLVGELAELHAGLGHGLDLGPLVLVDALGETAGDAAHRVSGLPAEHLLDLLGVGTVLDDLATDLHSDRADHAEDVPLGLRGTGTEDEVRGRQGVEVGDVAVHVVSHVEQLTQLLSGLRGLDAEHVVQRLGRTQVVCAWANAAEPGGQLVELVHGPADAELLEPSQLGHLPVGIGHVPVVVQEDLDLAMAFQPGDGVDGDPLLGGLLNLVSSLTHQYRAHMIQASLEAVVAVFSLTFRLMIEAGMVNA